MMVQLLCVLLGVCGPSPAAEAPPAPQSAVQAAQDGVPLASAGASTGDWLPPEAMGDLPSPSGAAAPASPAPVLPVPVLPAPVLAAPAVAPPEPPAAAKIPALAVAPVIRVAPLDDAPRGLPAWRRFAVAPPPADGKPTLTIMIDDMGLSGVQTARAVALPAPMTLSWMPYAPHVTQQASNAAARGHETMLHMPMEAFGHMFPGPDSLRTWLPPETNLAYLRAALDAVPNAIGLNQHEGSVASLSVPLMDEVMGELKDRGLAFVDSLTIPHSVALRRAQAAGLPAVARDVFLDNDPNPAAIRARLAEAEAIARHYGHAIAIGHPRPATMDVLEHYLPTLAARGFVLWPVSATIAAENRIQLSEAPVH